LITPEPKKKPKTAYRSFAAELPNQMWQTDFTHYRLTRPDDSPGADVEILCFLDDHSRYAISGHLPPTSHRPSRGGRVSANRR
jgi:transposase InsO family protein